MELIQLVLFFVFTTTALAQDNRQGTIQACLTKNIFDACSAACYQGDLASCQAALNNFPNITPGQRATIEKFQQQTAIKIQTEQCNQGNQFSCQTMLDTPNLSASERDQFQQKLKVAQDMASAQTIGEGITFIVIAIVIIGAIFLFKMVRRSQKEAEFADLPEHGPMKVNLEIKDIPPGDFLSKRFTSNLIVDVTISQADWKSIAQLGLMKHTLFTYPGMSGDPNDPDNIRTYVVEDLRRRGSAMFRNTIELQAAREKLIEGLRNLRDHIEEHRHGDRKESFEL
jgi:hypothetical protein